MKARVCRTLSMSMKHDRFFVLTVHIKLRNNRFYKVEKKIIQKSRIWLIFLQLL